MMVDSPTRTAIFNAMMFNLGIPDWRALRRRLCAGVTLLAYLVAAIGFPAPQTPAQSPHACGQQVCGCGTAAQCKANGCCCSHGTTPAPPAEQEPADCCSKKKPAAPCCVKESSTTQKPAKAPAKPKGNTVRWVLGISALKCRGGATQWISAEAALPLQAPVCWLPSWPYCHSLPVLHEYPFAIAEDLLDPPPRLEAV
jgi:hypothetical protein